MYTLGNVQKKIYTISETDSKKIKVMNHVFCETSMYGFKLIIVSQVACFRHPDVLPYNALPSKKSQAKSVPIKINKHVQMPYYSYMHARCLIDQMRKHMHVPADTDLLPITHIIMDLPIQLDKQMGRSKHSTC